MRYLKIITSFILNKRSEIYKYLIYLASVFIVLYIFPRTKQFDYEFQKGKKWQYETLYAPFDFAILKTEGEIELEKERIRKEGLTYFQHDINKHNQALRSFEKNFNTYFSLVPSSAEYEKYYIYGTYLINKIYATGVLPIGYVHQGGKRVALIKNHSETDVAFKELISIKDISKFLEKEVEEDFYRRQYYQLFFEIIESNLVYDEKFTNKVLNEAYSSISVTRDLILTEDVIVSEGELIGEEKYQILYSLEKQYSSEGIEKSDFYWIFAGNIIVISMILLMLFLFVRQYRPALFSNNTKVLFLFFNIILVVALTVFILRINPNYLYSVPICILPLTIKTFFDSRLGLFAHVLVTLLLGFIVPNGFEYIFLQTMVGIVTILTGFELYKRANLFITVAKITLVYIVSYFSIYITKEGSIEGISYLIFGLFIFNGLLTLFVQPLIYIYEKLFNLTSDVSLLELTDTSTFLLKEMAEKAPGTFHHSMQVANLAETAAKAIGANVLLTRVGALYHDIGKMENINFFTENQIGISSPHEDITPLESAKIIIDHVSKGEELAKKHKLPDRIIDFIKTHHGTTTVYYFYKKQESENGGEVDLEQFSYKGPKPFSKETAILMMSDSVEAASKSLKNPTVEVLKEFVNKIIEKQITEKQFVDSNITFSEIEKVKSVLIDKLINMYHLRIEYPK